MDGRITGGPPGQGGALPPGKAKKAAEKEGQNPDGPPVQLPGDQSTFGPRGGPKTQNPEPSTLYDAAMPWDLIDSSLSLEDEPAQDAPELFREADDAPAPTVQREVPREAPRPAAPVREAEVPEQPGTPAARPAEPDTPEVMAQRPHAQPTANPAPPSPQTAPPLPTAPRPTVSLAQGPVVKATVPQAAHPAAPQGSTPAVPADAPDPAPAKPAPAPTLPGAPATPRSSITGNLDPTLLLRFKHRELAEALKLQLTHPEAVVQISGKATCCAATLQRALLRADPKLYAAIASELIMTGQATLPGGQLLKLSPANRAWIEAQPFSPQEKLNAIVQGAFMESADPHGEYDLASDRFSAHDNPPRGLNLDQARRLNELLLQAPTLDPRELRSKVNAFMKAEGMDLLSDDPNLPPALVKDLLRSASEQATFAIVKARDPEGNTWVDEEGKPLVEGPEEEPAKRSHMVMVVGVDEEANTVTVIDALGKQRELPRDKFAQLLMMSHKWEDLEGIGSPWGIAPIHN